MKDHFPRLIVLFFAFFITVHLQTVFDDNITFYVYNASGYQFNSTVNNTEKLLETCRRSNNITLIAHGWRESINSVWTKAMIGNFTSARGGCVFFMDYYFYSRADYNTLCSNFNSITEVLTRKLSQLDQLGFQLRNSFLFGFSFGCHLVFEAGYVHGPRKIGRIDCCDPAGPNFQPGNALSTIHANDSAQFVQCIHTSNDFGSSGRYCQRDINMGRCGMNQPGATQPPYMSHGLCPNMYNNAFTVDFNMVNADTISQHLSSTCTPVQSLIPNVTKMPNCTMGFRFNSNFPYGEYWALTGTKYPWNSID